MSGDYLPLPTLLNITSLSLSISLNFPSLSMYLDHCCCVRALSPFTYPSKYNIFKFIYIFPSLSMCLDHCCCVRGLSPFTYPSKYNIFKLIYIFNFSITAIAVVSGDYLPLLTPLNITSLSLSISLIFPSLSMCLDHCCCVRVVPLDTEGLLGNLV